MTPEVREQDRRQFIANAIEVLNRSLDYAQTLASLAWIAVPTIADWCAVDVVENGVLQRLAVAHVDRGKLDFVEEIERRFPPDPDAPHGISAILRTGQPEIVEVITDEMMDLMPNKEYLALIRQLGFRSYIGVPLMRGGQPYGVITLIMAESGRHYDEADLATAMTLADRASAAVEHARLFRELQAAHDRAASANRAKDEFLAMLGHELRNPLAPIQTALELMELRAPDAFKRERTVIERQLRHVVRLVDDLLDVSRITRGKVELHRQEVDIADTIARSIEMASPLLEEKEHELVTSAPPGMRVHGDPERLAQVVTNLVTNAAKYTERGGRITVSAAPVDGQIVIRVRDTGVGIPPELLDHVFEAFYQDRQEIDRAKGGLGLGLAIVKSLVEMHGGSVSAHSEGRGKGSEIVVRLPALEAMEKVSAGAAAVPPGSRATILVVDDNPDALNMLADALESRGFSTARAHDAPSALAIAARVRPQIALLDIGLPVMDGWELGRRLREIPDLAGLQLVAVTGYGQASDRATSEAAGFAAHLVKPISLDAVLATIGELSGNQTISQ